MPSPSRPMSSRRAEWFLFLILLLGSVYFLPRWADWNVNSRFDVALAVVDDGMLAIDRYVQNTGDYAQFNGHYYSDKAPGTSFLGLAPYWLFKTLGGRALIAAVAPRVTNGALAQTLDPNGRGLIQENLYRFAALTFVTFWVVALPSALLGIVLYRLLCVWAVRPRDALVLTLGYGLGTPAFAYANNLYGHQLAAVFLFTAFYLAFRAAHGARPRAYPLLTGALLGLALITEYPSALIVAGIGLYALWKWRNLKQIALLCAAAVPPLVLMAAYNYAIFNTPLPVGYLYSTLYTQVHSIGLVSLTYPKLDELLQLTFGLQRGLFVIAPFLLLAVPGFVWFARLRSARAELLVCLWASVSFLLFNSSSAMWQGGFAVGPRYIVPMLPFMTVPVIFVFDHASSSIARLGIYALLALSWLLTWATALGGQMFPQYQSFPLIEYSLPRLYVGDVARNFGMFLNFKGFASLIPLALLVLALGAAFWRQPRRPAPAPNAPGEPRALPH